MRTAIAAGLALLLLGTSTFGLVSGPARAGTDGEVAPYEAMRALQALQDRIAVGDAVAQAAHAKAIGRTGRAFASAKGPTWRDKRNARALIVYLFSGGNAAAVESAIPTDLVAPDLKVLYEGALAYGLGDDETARAKLLPVDPRTMPSGLGGHLALVQATLTASQDAGKAIGLLDVARLLEPGTLVEEAALRKEISLIGASGDLEKFALLARRYLSGFPRSMYADNFRQLVAHVAMQLGDGNSEEAGAKLGKLMVALDRVERRRLYLAVAREALVAGRTTMAALAAVEAGRLAGRDDPDASRAQLYLGAASIVGPRYETGMTMLGEVAVARLDARDRALRQSALAVATLIREPAASVTNPSGQEQAQATLVADADRALVATDPLVKAMPK